MRAIRNTLVLASLAAVIGAAGCGDKGEDKPKDKPAAGAGDKGKAPAAADQPPAAVQEPLVDGPYPSLLLAEAWFWKNAENKTKPGPARLEIWRSTPSGWQKTRLEDAESNVFHKAIPYDGGIVTLGGEGAILKKWKFEGGAWKSETLWQQKWGGKFNRLRDVEVGDVDGDGKDELVIATHDAGVIAVFNPAEEGGQPQIIELDQKADTFVHEIEIGDVDGDGKKEFFATPTGRNSATSSQGGEMVMYRWDGTTYVRSVVDPFGKTHAKEILTADLNGDGRSELFSVVEAEVENNAVVKPVEIRQYTLNRDGTFTGKSIATLDDRQTRFLVPGDFDGDGDVDLVAAAMKTGLWFLQNDGKGSWTKTQIDAVSSGFEHASYAADLDGDGKIELYVAADEQMELKKYAWNPQTKAFDKTLLGRLTENSLTWNITSGQF